MTTSRESSLIRIGILGATGYTARELIRILLRHPRARIEVVTSRQTDVPSLGQMHPQLRGRLELEFENSEPSSLIGRVDCVFSCLPHAASAESLQPFVDSEVRVVDLSADFRLWNSDLYQQWYGETHPAPSMLGQIPYGLPELYRDRLRGAKFVANPGCYPTAAILPLAPFLRATVIEHSDLIIDSKSGVSGAGRTPKLTTHFPECNEGISAYNIGQHRHSPEIAQILSDVAGVPVEMIFTPHLIPMDRGILTTSYARLREDLSADELLSIARDAYATEPFVRVVSNPPSTKDTAGTNFCDLAVRRVGDRLVTVSCIDNLIKGASGAAVQNFNLMYGFAETLGLEE